MPTMRRSGEMLAHLHDLRVLVSAIQLHVDDVLGTPGVMDGGRYELRDRIDLLADVLRALIAIQGEEPGGSAARQVDLRAIAFLAHGRHPGSTVGDCRGPVHVHVRPDAVLELLDLAVVWAIGDRGRCTIEVRDRPATLVVSATGARAPCDDGSDLEIEQAIASMATACRTEASIHREQRIVVLQLREGPDGLDG
jgi:hypothetical protein